MLELGTTGLRSCGAAEEWGSPGPVDNDGKGYMTEQLVQVLREELRPTVPFLPRHAARIDGPRVCNHIATRLTDAYRAGI